MIDQVELKLFNVGHGLSCMIREYPSNYVTLIDLGADSNLSPLQQILNSGLRADQIFITHPHGDHISEIDKLYNHSYQPDGFYVQDYDWEDVASKEQSHLRDKVKTLKKIKSTIRPGDYAGGAELKYWRYTPKDAKENFGDSKYINNSSLAIVYKWKDFKIAILGDLESDALKNYCNFQQFVDFAQGTYLLVAPHHGHNSGFPELWVQKIGKPYLTLVSIKDSDPHVCKKYQSADFNKGVKINNSTRYTLTTRQDGTISIKMNYNNNQANWSFDFS